MVNCNRSCYYCPRVHLNGKDGYMKMELFRKLMNEISKFSGRTVYLFRRGESLLHPEIINMFRYARPRVEDIQLTTNATLLTPEMSDELINLLDFISLVLTSRKSILAIAVVITILFYEMLNIS